MIKIFKIVGLGVLLGLGLPSAFANKKAVQDIEFPELNKSYLKEFQRYTVQDLKLLSSGLSKDQIRHILGAPSFNEGIFAVRTWNYILDVQNPIDNSFKRCQLRIDFDNKYLTKAFHWKGEECQQLLRNGVNQEKAVIVPKQDNSIRQVNVFFQFDKSDLNYAMSNMSLQEIVNEIKRSKSTRILIQGYADSIGQHMYNQRLSERRTSEIAKYLVAQGIPSNYILIDARGATEQYKNCDVSTPQVERLSCLAPNRRVTISW